MKPAPPVTRMRIRRSVCGKSPAERAVSTALRLLAHGFRLGAVRLQVFGPLQVGDGLAATAELPKGVAEVVVRVALVGVARTDPGELLYRLLQQGQGGRIVAQPHE